MGSECKTLFYICQDGISVKLYYAQIYKSKVSGNFNTDLFPKNYSVIIVMIGINKVATTTTATATDTNE